MSAPMYVASFATMADFECFCDVPGEAYETVGDMAEPNSVVVTNLLPATIKRVQSWVSKQLKGMDVDIPSNLNWVSVMSKGDWHRYDVRSGKDIYAVLVIRKAEIIA